MDKKLILSDVLANLNEQQSVVIFGHRNPDGDALGSTLGLWNVFQKMQIKSTVIMPNAFPESFSWMPGSEKILNYEENEAEVKALVKDAETYFFLDFNTPTRLGQMNDDLNFDLSKAVIIDHHPDPNTDVAYLFSDTKKSSTCEWVYVLLKESNYSEYISEDVANCLFTGLITDTGGFNHNASSPEFFRTIADIIELGADKDEIYRKVFHTQNESRFRLLGTILHQNLILNYEKGVAIMWLRADDLQKNDYQNGDTEGFVNMPLSLEGINKSVLLTETDDEVKMSFRSRAGYVINEYAATYFNGGGHKNAAGGRSTESFEKTMEKLQSTLDLM